jgi:hypothetical protein
VQEGSKKGKKGQKLFLPFCPFLPFLPFLLPSSLLLAQVEKLFNRAPASGVNLSELFSRYCPVVMKLPRKTA